MKDSAWNGQSNLIIAVADNWFVLTAGMGFGLGFLQRLFGNLT
jgi:hypothetical protein